MAQIDDELAKLKQTKADIAKSITDKGGVLENPSNFSTYSTAIDNLPSGGGTEPVNAFSVNDSNYNNVVFPTNWADTKLIVLNRPSSTRIYYDLPDLTIDLNSINIPLIALIGAGIRINWNLIVNDKSLKDFYPKLFSGNNYNGSWSSYGTTAIFNITLNGNGLAKRANFYFSGLYGNINITFNNAPISSAEYMFYSSYVDSLSITGLDTSLCTNFNNMFYGFKHHDGSKHSFKTIDTSNGTNFSYMFYDCETFNEILPLDTSKGTNFYLMLYSTDYLIKVHEISVKSATSTSYMFSYSKVRYALIKDIGTQQNNTIFDMGDAPNWGIEDSTIPLSIGARLSVIDSLITYSFDRATAGYDPCKITLSSNTKALLTEDEIALITSKGYTIA